MEDTETRPARGRPRHFDLDQALATGQALFHAQGYDAVGLTAITEAVGIKPPSFYAAFGSKAGYFERILERYGAAASPFDTAFDDERPVGDVIAHLLVSAARAYAADPHARGCLVVETLRSGADPKVVAIARDMANARSAKLRAFVARTHPRAAEAVDDYVTSILFGLSACARQSWSVERLVRAARAASEGVAFLLR